MTDAALNRTSLAGIPGVVGIAQGAKSAGLITVAIGGVNTIVQANRDATFAAQDRVFVVKAGAIWVAMCRIDSAATSDQTTTNPTPPAPKPTVKTGVKTFTPVETRSYRSTVYVGWRNDNDDLYQGQYGGQGLHRGCAFYGSGPRSLAGATVTAASIKMRRRSQGGVTAAQDTTLWLVTNKTRPGGAPTLTSSTDGPNLKWGQQTAITIPTSWAQAMVDGTAGGLAIAASTPYVILDGRSHYSASFQLTIRWKRTT